MINKFIANTCAPYIRGFTVFHYDYVGHHIVRNHFSIIRLVKVSVQAVLNQTVASTPSPDGFHVCLCKCACNIVQLQGSDCQSFGHQITVLSNQSHSYARILWQSCVTLLVPGRIILSHIVSDMHTICVKRVQEYVDQLKWSTFCGRHFEMHSLEKRYLYFDSNRFFLNFIIPTATKLGGGGGGGYIGFTLSVCLSVCLSVNLSCPPCSIYSSGWILSIFGTNDH